MSPAKNKWIRNIHVAKTKLNLSDEVYREILLSCAKVTASSAITTWNEYNAIMQAFEKLGFKLPFIVISKISSTLFNFSIKALSYSIFSSKLNEGLAFF